MSQAGFVSFDYAESILTNLGDISVNIGGDGKHTGAQFNFDPTQPSGFYDMFYNFKMAANEDLYPIGEVFQAFSYVGKSKRIYWGDWRDFNWIGDSIEDYLNNLFDKKFESKLLWTNPNAEEELKAAHKAADELIRLEFPHLKLHAYAENRIERKNDDAKN